MVASLSSTSIDYPLSSGVWEKLISLFFATVGFVSSQDDPSTSGLSVKSVYLGQVAHWDTAAAFPDHTCPLLGQLSLGENHEHTNTK